MNFNKKNGLQNFSITFTKQTHLGLMAVGKEMVSNTSFMLVSNTSFMLYQILSFSSGYFYPHGLDGAIVLIDSVFTIT